MNPFDEKVLHFLNQFAQKSQFCDHAIALYNNQLLTGAFLMSIFWWAWFRDDGRAREYRPIAISGLFLSAAALFAARALALLLPFRERPLRNPMLHLRIPFGVDLQRQLGWSSFPSDHAVFYFALATSIFLFSRRLGIAIYCYVFFFICAPLVYQGLHYPTDILGGALLGTGIACLTLITPLRNLLSSATMRWFERSPPLFYACFFLLTFLFGTMFDSFRSIATAIWRTCYLLIHH